MIQSRLLLLYLGLSYLLPLVAPWILRKRLKRGKEDAARWHEKLGRGLAPRPAGRLVWLHAVGLGEVMSLRGLIARMAVLNPELSFLVTSTTAASARVFAQNLPARTLHQFLPVDAPSYRRRFLDHFQPDLCIWVEQDLWPGFVSDLARRDISQVMIAARMDAVSFTKHKRAAGLYADLYRKMVRVTAQDAQSAGHLTALGAQVDVTGSLKPAAPVLGCDPAQLALLEKAVAGRFIWAVAPSHAQDEAMAIAALQADDLLIVAPRHPERAAAMEGPRLSLEEYPGAADNVWLCNTFGDLGLVYRVADAVLIGGTFSAIEGHNPWEAAMLGCAVLHGPHVGNFAGDFAALDAAGAAVCVKDADALAAALQSRDLAVMTQQAQHVVAKAATQTDTLAADLVALV